MHGREKTVVFHQDLCGPLWMGAEWAQQPHQASATGLGTGLREERRKNEDHLPAPLSSNGGGFPGRACGMVAEIKGQVVRKALGPDEGREEGRPQQVT